MAVKRYNGTSWDVVAGVGPQGAAATSSSIATWVKTASGGETSVSGNDDSSQPLSYTIGQELVFINGVLQKRGDDYVANTGNSITGLTALTAGDIVSVWTVNAFSVSNAISNTIVDAKGDILVGTGADTPGRLAVGTNGQVLTAASTTGTGLTWATPTPTFVGVKATASSATAMSNATWTAINFNTEAFDSDGFHSTSTNTSRITIPTGKGGKYLLTAIATYASGSTTGSRYAQFYINGAQTSDSFISIGAVGSSQPAGALTATFSLAAGDYVELYQFQNTGGSINNEPGWSSFTATFLGA